MKIKIAETVLYSNLYIGLAASLLTWMYAQFYSNEVHLELLLFVFGSTQLAYSFLMEIPKQNEVDPRSKWFQKNYLLFIVISLISFICVIFALYIIKQYVFLLVPFVFVFLYSHRLKPKNWMSIRKIPYLKFMLISLVWVYTTQVMNLLIYNSINDLNLVLVLQEFLLICSVALFFDYKDQILDLKENIKTISQHISFEKIKVIYYILNTFSLVLMCVFSSNYSIIIVQTFILIYAIFSFKGLKTELDKNSFYFKMDGILIASPIFYLILNLQKLSVVTDYSFICK